MGNSKSVCSHLESDHLVKSETFHQIHVSPPSPTPLPPGSFWCVAPAPSPSPHGSATLYRRCTHLPGRHSAMIILCITHVTCFESPNLVEMNSSEGNPKFNRNHGYATLLPSVGSIERFDLFLQLFKASKLAAFIPAPSRRGCFSNGGTKRE